MLENPAAQLLARWPKNQIPSLPPVDLSAEQSFFTLARNPLLEIQATLFGQEKQCTDEYLFVFVFFKNCMDVIQTQKGSNEHLFNTDTQYAHFWGNPLYQATKQHFNKQINSSKWKKETYLVLV